jgi:hypothetical protein
VLERQGKEIPLGEQLHVSSSVISGMGDINPTRLELEVRRTPADQSLRRMCPTGI